ncbi:MAG: phosphate acyltransferase PlsX [Chitinivibrionia bacterium]|nr:phosphate acyltransferase PlsX [Chitinivibrionia bacterium]
MRIAVDAMGGDRGPETIVEGALSAAGVNPGSIHILLVGDENVLRPLVEAHATPGAHVEIVHASQAIDMSEMPSAAVRKKKDASILVAARLQKEGAAEAMVSAGNTGAAIASSLVTIGRLHGLSRPAIATIMPTMKKGAVVLDVGANSECTPRNLLQFAVMGTVYAEHQLGIQNPRVGLLNIGEEPTKGKELVREAFKMLERENLNFVGNVEGRDVFSGNVDVVVCDGFVGNVVLKFSESIVSFVTHILKSEIEKRFVAKLGAVMMRGAFSSLRSKLDYAEYGGALLLGVDGVTIIAHGKSSSRAIKNAVLSAQKFVQLGINDKIEERFKEMVDNVANVS